MEHHKTIILGAGVTGLSIAKSLLSKGENDLIILEKNDFVGGLCSSTEKNGFTIDFGPHKLFSLIPGMMDEFKEINGEDNLVVKKVNSLFFLGKKFQFPINPVELAKNISPKTVSAGVQIPLSLAKSLIVYNLLRKKDDSFKDYLMKGFGKKAYQILFEGYAWKVWADPDTLSKDIAKIRIPIPNISDLIKKTFNKKSQPSINASEFYYPKHGMRQFTKKMAEIIKQNKGEILLNQNLISITKKADNFVIKTDKTEFSCNNLVSTIPLNSLINLYDFSTAEIKKTSAKLRYNDLSLIYLFFDQPKIITDNWIFFPEKEYSFNRLSEQKSFSPYTVPKDKTVLCAEITNPKFNSLSDQEMLSRVIADLIKAKIINNHKDKKIFDQQVLRFKNIYPIYDLDYKKNLNKVLAFLDQNGIITIGRYGLFNYNNIDHCFDMGKTVAEHITANKSPAGWIQARKKFDDYKIVD